MSFHWVLHILYIFTVPFRCSSELSFPVLESNCSCYKFHFSDIDFPFHEWFIMYLFICSCFGEGFYFSFHTPLPYEMLVLMFICLFSLYFYQERVVRSELVMGGWLLAFGAWWIFKAQQNRSCHSKFRKSPQTRSIS